MALNILTEDQLRVALLAGKNEALVSTVPDKLAYCDRCDRYYDTRSGCEADIRFDAAQRIRLELIDWINSMPCPTVHREHFLAQLDRICPKE